MCCKETLSAFTVLLLDLDRIEQMHKELKHDDMAPRIPTVK